MKKKKRHVGIRVLVMIPVLFLGIYGIISNLNSLSSLRNVNSSAKNITENYMESISQMSEIQNDVQYLSLRTSDNR